MTNHHTQLVPWFLPVQGNLQYLLWQGKKETNVLGIAVKGIQTWDIRRPYVFQEMLRFLISNILITVPEK